MTSPSNNNYPGYTPSVEIPKFIQDISSGETKSTENLSVKAVELRTIINATITQNKRIAEYEARMNSMEKELVQLKTESDENKNRLAGLSHDMHQGKSRTEVVISRIVTAGILFITLPLVSIGAYKITQKH